jgi:hypothetical protein
MKARPWSRRSSCLTGMPNDDARKATVIPFPLPFRPPTRSGSFDKKASARHAHESAASMANARAKRRKLAQNILLDFPAAIANTFDDFRPASIPAWRSDLESADDDGTNAARALRYIPDNAVCGACTVGEQITKSAAAALFVFGGTITGATKGVLRVFPHSTHELSTTTSSLRIGVASNDELLELNKVDTE